MKHVAGFLVALVALAGCSGTSVDGFNIGDLFSDVPASPVKIENKTGTDIVLFRENLDTASVLGGVPNNSTFGIKYVEGGYYLIKAVTKADLEANQSDPKQCKVIATAFVYVDSTWTTNTFTVADPGAGRVILQNNSSRYVEVKGESFYGPTITYLSPKEVRTQYLTYGDYDFFPCYVYVQQISGKVVGTTRKFKSTQAGSAGIYSGSAVQTIVIDEEAAPVERDIYVYIKNKTTSGGRFAVQTTIYKSTIDREVINGNGGVQIYRFSETSKTFGANTIHLKQTMGYESARYGTDLALTAGQTAYLVYSGAFDTGTWKRCATLAEFEAE